MTKKSTLDNIKQFCEKVGDVSNPMHHSISSIDLKYIKLHTALSIACELNREKIVLYLLEKYGKKCIRIVNKILDMCTYNECLPDCVDKFKDTVFLWLCFYKFEKEANKNIIKIW